MIELAPAGYVFEFEPRQPHAIIGPPGLADVVRDRREAIAVATRPRDWAEPARSILFSEAEQARDEARQARARARRRA